MKGAFLPYGNEGREILSNNKVLAEEGLTRYVGEEISLVYSPFYVKDGKLHDAFEKKPLSSFDLSNTEIQASLSKKEDWSPEFIPTLCPQCGWDLLGEKDSFVVLCRNCHTAWTSRNNSLNPVPFSIIKQPGVEESSVMYLPFWRMKFQFEGADLLSYADLIRLANLPRVPSPIWKINQ